jgi:hypothetical protein
LEKRGRGEGNLIKVQPAGGLADVATYKVAVDGGGLELLCYTAGAGPPWCSNRRVPVGVAVQGFTALKALDALMDSVGTASASKGSTLKGRARRLATTVRTPSP